LCYNNIKKLTQEAQPNFGLSFFLYNMKKILLVILASVSIGAIIFLYYNFRIAEKVQYNGPIEKIKIAAYKGERSSLIYIAKEKGFFQDNGIEVEILDNDSGVRSVQSINNSEVDIATAAEYPLVSDILENENNLKIFGAIDFVKAYEVIANKNSGINSIEDLRGKKIGLKKKSEADFLFGVFLTSHNIADNEVGIIDLEPTNAAEKIANGEIDAAVVCDPYTNILKNYLGNNLADWDVQPNRNFYHLLFAKADYINKNPELVKRFLIALIQAEKYINSHLLDSQLIVERNIGVDLKYLQRVWDKNNFSVSLDQSLVLTMEDESRWRISKEQLNRKSPNYLNYLDFKILDNIDSSRVTIIR